MKLSIETKIQSIGNLYENEGESHVFRFVCGNIIAVGVSLRWVCMAIILLCVNNQGLFLGQLIRSVCLAVGYYVGWILCVKAYLGGNRRLVWDKNSCVCGIASWR